MNKRLIIDIGKYLLAIGLLVWVVRANWAPTAPPRAVASLAVSTIGLASGSPLTAVTAAVPGRTQSPGLGYVWQTHVVQGEPINFGYLALAFSIFVTALFITLTRWYYLVRALDLEISFVDAIRYGLIGIFFNMFLPGSVGGDIIKAAALASGQTRRAAAVASVIMDRVIALWALVWFVALLGSAGLFFGLLAGPAQATASLIVTIAGCIVASSAAVWMLLGFLPSERAERFAGHLAKLPLVGSTAAEFWRVAWMYRQKQATVVFVMLLSWVGQVGYTLAFFLGLSAVWSPMLGAMPTLAQHFLLVPMGLVMQALVPTPGGAGGGEWSFGALYLLFRAAESNGVLASLVQRIIGWTVALLGYCIYLWSKPTAPAQAVESAPVDLHLTPKTASTVSS